MNSKHQKPHLPMHVPISRIEQYLDRIALEIAAAKDPEPYLIWFEFLEYELKLRREMQATLERALERAKRLDGVENPKPPGRRLGA